MGKGRFPLTAIVGQQRLKLALLVNVIDPLVGGVLIRGNRGTGKSTAARALAGLLPEQQVVAGCVYGCDPHDAARMCDDCDARVSRGELEVSTRRMRVVELPINASLDRVVGGIDLRATIQFGRSRFAPGILAAANRNVLYVDEVNLLADEVMDTLLDVLSSGVNRVRREGIETSHPAQLILIGTMNSQEGELRPQLLDRFGLCVDLTGSTEAQHRVQIAERDAAFRAGDAALMNPLRHEEAELAAGLIAARARLHSVAVSPEIARLISQTCLDAGVSGHRPDVVVRRAARALAALRLRQSVTPEDVQDAAHLALVHRSRRAVDQRVPLPPKGESASSGNRSEPNSQANQLPSPQRRRPPGEPNGTGEGGGSEPRSSEDGPGDAGAGGRSPTDDDGAQVARRPLDIEIPAPRIELAKTARPRRKSGKRMLSEAVDRRGRYVSARPQERVTDVAIDASLRAAAPHQIKRGRQLGEPLKLQPDDLRQKIREHKVGSLVVFVIDGSASMDADSRMATAKTVILNLLNDAYVRRDRVAAIVFRGRSAETILEPTSSVSLARRHLEQMAIGGTTPLPHGLLAAYKLMNRARRLDPTVRPLLVLVSDGNGNVSLGDGDPKGESLDIAKKIAGDGIDAIVVDSSPAPVRDQGAMMMYEDLRPKFCVELAAQMQALYLPMNVMSAARLGRLVMRRRDRGARPFAAEIGR